MTDKKTQKWLLAGGLAAVGIYILTRKKRPSFQEDRRPLPGSQGDTGIVQPIRLPAVPPILVIGDSIAVGTGQSLITRLGRDYAASYSTVGLSVSGILDKYNRIPQSAKNVANTIVISAGTNNITRHDTANIMTQITYLVNEVRRSWGGYIILIGPPPGFGYDENNEAWTSGLENLHIAMSRMENVVDLWDLLGDPAYPGFYHENYHANDWLHPNRRGYDRIADAIIQGDR